MYEVHVPYGHFIGTVDDKNFQDVFKKWMIYILFTVIGASEADWCIYTSVN